MARQSGRLIAAALLLAAVNAAAQIPPSRAEVRAFRADHPCPRTGQVKGVCRGYHVDHIIALCAGGPDHRSNMQWITVEDQRFRTSVGVHQCRKLGVTAQTLIKNGSIVSRMLS